MDMWKNFPRPPWGTARVKKNLYPSLENSGGSFCTDSPTFEQHSYTHIPHSWCVTHLSVKPAVTLIFMFLKTHRQILVFSPYAPIIYTAEALTNLFFHWTDMHFNTFGCNNRRCHPCSLFWKMKGHDVILTLTVWCAGVYQTVPLCRCLWWPHTGSG